MRNLLLGISIQSARYIRGYHSSYNQQGNSYSDCDIQFSVLRRRLVEIKQGRLIR